MDSLIEICSAKIKEMIEGTHFHLIDIKLSKSKRFTSFQIFIDRDDGFLNLEDCEKLSRSFQDILDRDEIIHGDYRLEVSSPGIGRSLKERWEYAKNIEKTLRIDIIEEDDDIRTISGQLTNISNDGITVVSANSSMFIKWAQISKATVKPPW